MNNIKPLPLWFIILIIIILIALLFFVPGCRDEPVCHYDPNEAVIFEWLCSGFVFYFGDSYDITFSDAKFVDADPNECVRDIFTLEDDERLHLGGIATEDETAPGSDFHIFWDADKDVLVWNDRPADLTIYTKNGGQIFWDFQDPNIVYTGPTDIEELILEIWKGFYPGHDFKGNLIIRDKE